MPAKRKQAEVAKSAEPTETTQDEFTAFESGSDEEESSVGDETEMSAEKRAELLKGFDSDSESDDEAQGDEDNRIIELSNLTPTISSALTKKKKVDETGILYIGRIPHGFYEEEMTSYFSQFGTILNLRMSRSKKTGRSKHYAFIEFGDRGVAEIVAQTMHNYLLASHLLQVILLTPEEFKKKGGRDLFKGSGKKFKAVPWAQIAKDRVESPKTQEQWQELEKREKKRRSVQQQKLKAAGIDYEYESPAAKKLKASEAPKAIKSKKDAPATRKVSGASARKASGSRKVSVK
ncbi:Ribosomal biogenesis protein Gar2 [Taphrina deformans PYCC 5710]|uniref:Ribosomal biogenesis protein Gar2 n=1 Tax=Taphrina deformans (strain PYCC 5710 / ATCC 11124 / CBS 356.35 / IMI 108563 / JCM 9778 / NBRC 8474) TaxID=1097556 RepID=R4XH52_TAPDE|nr:Ribosomal biogenesis protein Gar2 [Taphrina deformans PYCC 5710]|eukprot:CCG85178.1 Ribosomal biogenesis protein Gar2 [Taphrina deformans PYCC 5710]